MAAPTPAELQAIMAQQAAAMNQPQPPPQPLQQPAADPYLALKKNVPTLQGLGQPPNLQQALIDDYQKSIAQQSALQRQSRQQQMKGIQDIESRISKQEAPRSALQSMDLSPLLALTDSWSGNNVLKGYKAPTSNEAREKQGIDLRQALQGQRDKLTDADMASLKTNMDNKMTLAQLKMQAQGSKGSLGQQALDRDYAKDYNSWTSAQRPSLDANIGTIDRAIEALQSPAAQNYTGRFAGRLPDIAKFNEAIAMRDGIRQVVNESLRATLGSQFTEKEGERIFSQTYNEALPPEENVKKLQKLSQILQQTKANKDAKAVFFEQNGTLQGFKPPHAGGDSLNEISSALEGKSGGGGGVTITPAEQAEFERLHQKYGGQ